MCAGACHFDVDDQWRVQSAGTACLETWFRSHGTVACSAFGLAGDQASYVHGASAQKLLGDTIGRNLAKTVQNFPDKLAVSSMHQKVSRTHKSSSLRPKHVYDQDAVQKRLTYMEFSQAVEQVSRGLLGVGVKPGEAVRDCSDSSHLTCHHHLELLTHVITSACCCQTNSAAQVQICCASGCEKVLDVSHAKCPDTVTSFCKPYNMPSLTSSSQQSINSWGREDHCMLIQETGLQFSLPTT